MMGEAATVVLPCAGDGSRLGLPFGKELLPLGPGYAPLDATLELLRPHAGHIRLVVVLGSGREATARRILTLTEGLLPAAFITQRPGLGEATGAVLSAAPWFGERNLVLLPDQILTSPPPDPAGQALDLLHEAPFCFLAARETDPVKISADGALRISDTTPARLLGYAEHPPAGQAAGFNAVWFGYGFRREHAIPALSLMHRAACGQPVTDAEFAASPLPGCPVVDTGPYRDTGTWPAVLQLWEAAARKAASP
jgi:hypothetical protein